MDQTSLGMDYFGIHEGGQIYVKESLLTFTSGSSLTVTATDTGDLSGKLINIIKKKKKDINLSANKFRELISHGAFSVKYFLSMLYR